MHLATARRGTHGLKTKRVQNLGNVVAVSGSGDQYANVEISKKVGRENLLIVPKNIDELLPGSGLWGYAVLIN